MLKCMIKSAPLFALAALLVGCASPAPKMDYTAFKESKPHSILILPPVSESTDVNAGSGVMAQMSYPLAEAGYYVLPVTLVSETFKQNGLSTANDIQAVSPDKLRKIFGADAALYVDVTKYGVTYTVFDSVATVTVKAKLVDLRSGRNLWQGSAMASNAGSQNNSGFGLIGLLVQAAVKQIVNHATDASYPVAGVASQQLLAAGRPNGLLYGPRSPRYGTD
jgi:hypothetical protein